MSYYNSSDLKSGFFWLLVAIFILIESWRLNLGNLSVPGPGFLPFLCGVVLGSFSIILIIVTLSRSSPTQAKDWYSGIRWKKWGISLASLVAYAFFLETMGFIVCTGAFVMVVMTIMQPQRWRTALVVAVSATAASFLIFQIWLKAQLPVGFLGI
jgi:putative tricarboxylic transport membrane protein